MRRLCYRRRQAFLWALLLLAALAGTARAEVEIQLGVEDWGLGGAIKNGLWTPLYVELRSRGGDFSGFLEVEAEAGQQVLPVFRKKIELVQDTLTCHWLYFRAPGNIYRGRGPRCTWRVLDSKKRLVHEQPWKNPILVPAHDTLIGVLRTPNFSDAGIATVTDQNSGVRNVVRYHSVGWLPDHVIGYASADVLVWMNPDPVRIVNVAQRNALVQYVRQGGHLVLAAGAEWQALTKDFLAELLPADPAGSILVESLPALEEMDPPRGTDKSIVLMQMKNPRGEVLMTYNDSPIVVRGRAGLGHVSLIGFDPTLKPFSALKKRELFWQKVLAIETRRINQQEARNLQPVSEPLVRALSDFPGFTPIDFKLVGFFMLSYIILIGPVDYFVLKKFKKLHWTWVTFPSIAILSSALAFFALSSGRVTGLHANSLDIVDAISDGEQITGTSFMTMLSPRTMRYTIELDGADNGSILPREYASMVGGAGLSQTKCHVQETGKAIEDVLVRVWDAQTFEATWQAPAPDLPKVSIAFDRSAPSGSVENTTGATLEDATLFAAGKAYTLGQIRPGQTVTLSRRNGRHIQPYAIEMRPEELLYGGYYSSREFSATREQADRVARWISLFRYAIMEGDSTSFRRWATTHEGYAAAEFDLCANLQLSDLHAADQAVLIYSIPKSFVKIKLANLAPKEWERTVVRMRIPLGGAQDSGGSDP